MQELHGVEAHLSGQVDAGFKTSVLLVLKLPKGIGGEGNAITAATRGLAYILGLGTRRLGVSRCCRAGQANGRGRLGEKMTTVKSHDSGLRMIPLIQIHSIDIVTATAV